MICDRHIFCSKRSELCCYFLVAVYVFLGDPHALIDFMRALDAKNLNNGEYLVIAVQDDPFEPNKQTKYFKTCTCSQFRNAVVLRAVARSGLFRSGAGVCHCPFHRPTVWRLGDY